MGIVSVTVDEAGTLLVERRRGLSSIALGAAKAPGNTEYAVSIMCKNMVASGQKRISGKLSEEETAEAVDRLFGAQMGEENQFEQVTEGLNFH